MDKTADEVKRILRCYFEYDDNGEPNPEYDPSMSAQDALDQIHDLVGKI